MPMQPPRFGRQSVPRKTWARPLHEPDKRKRGRAGMRERAQVIAEEPLCRKCEERGVATMTEVVDHVIPLSEGGSDNRSNKQGLCKPCHDEKSANERAAAQRRRSRR